LKLEEKKQIVEGLREKFSKSKVLIITDYKGLDVKKMSALRRKLRDEGIECRVVKNTMLVRASEGTDVAAVSDAFKGPNAVVFGYEDPISPAKLLVQFAKENDKLEIKAGFLNGRVLDPSDIKALAALPSREQLLSKLLSVMIGVPTAFVNALSGVPRNLVNVLNAVKDKKEAA
jgi:large subunit ribosomal protein L10